MNDVQMFWSLCAECVDFLSQRRSPAVWISLVSWCFELSQPQKITSGLAVWMESRHGEGQTDKTGAVSGEKRSDRVLTTYIRYVLGWAASEEF